MRTLPEGIDQRSACRHPDWTGPDDLEIKIQELREITDWEKPIYVKVGASRPYYDTALAVKSGADVVVLDGMQGGTAATQDVFIEHVGIPTLAAIRPAVQALQDFGHAPQGAADRLGRHPQRRRRGQVPGAGRRRGLHRHRGADRAGRQRPASGGRVPQARHHRRRLRRLARGPRPRRHHHAGPGAGRAPRSGAGRQAPRELPVGADPGGADHRARLRQEPRAQSGARGPGGPHHRGRRHGARAAGRHRAGYRGSRTNVRWPWFRAQTGKLLAATAPAQRRR